MLKEDNHWPSGKEGLEEIARDEAMFSAGHDVLSSSTELTLLLRLCMVHRLFECEEADVELMERLIDSDPYLSSMDDLAKAKHDPDTEVPPPSLNRAELLLPVQLVLQQREDWAEFKTVGALRA